MIPLAQSFRQTKGKERKTMVTILHCNFCGNKFKKNITKDTFEVPCPKCKENDIDVITMAVEKVYRIKHVPLKIALSDHSVA